MNVLFSKIQDSVTENNLKQQQMLTSHAYFIGGLLATSHSAANVFALVVSVSFASGKKLLSTELYYMSEKMLQNKTLPFARKAELLRLAEEHICGLGRALNILIPMVEIVLELNCQFQNNTRKFSAVADEMEGRKKKLVSS